MGATASVPTPAAASRLTKKLTQDEFSEAFGSQESSPHLFYAICDENGLVDPQIMQSFYDPIEREVLTIYLEYCPDGSMKLGIFVKFCVELKLLSKKNFCRKDAEVLFQKYATTKEGMQEKQINYLGLRFHIFQDIAAIQRTSPYQLMSKMAEYEGPASRHEVASSSHVSSAASTDNAPFLGGDKLITLSSEQAEIVRKACIQLQKLTRSTLAAKEAKARKERRKLSMVEKPNILEALGPPSTLEEKSCHDLFLRFCGANEEMSLQDFYNFCYYASLLSSSATFAPSAPKKQGSSSSSVPFTKSDAEHLFKRAMARFYIPATKSYAQGVVFGKRILYPVFRLVVVPDLAASQRQSLEDFLRLLVRVRRKMSLADEDLEEGHREREGRGDGEEETQRATGGGGERGGKSNERMPSLSLLG
jgi:hypothetical protein